MILLRDLKNFTRYRYIWK